MDALGESSIGIAAEQLLAVREGAPEEEQHHIVLGAELHARASSLSQN